MGTASPVLHSRKNRTILVVSSKENDILTVSLLLKKFDYAVSTAASASEAIDAISRAVPALVIAEVALAGMSGLDLMQLLRQTRRTASVPMVFLVPLSDAAAENRCIGMGAAGCLAKPVQAEELYRVVQSILELMPRTDIRIDARLPVSVDNVPLSCDEGICDINLSEHGMYIPLHDPVPRNRTITVQFHLRNRTVSAEGAVLYSNTSTIRPNRHPGVGLRFTSITPQDQAFIRAFIHEEITRDIRAALDDRARS